MQYKTRWAHKFGSVLLRLIYHHPTMCLLLTKIYEIVILIQQIILEVCLGYMIYVGNGNIHIYV